MKAYETLSVGGIDRRSTLGHFKCHENERGEEASSMTAWHVTTHGDNDGGQHRHLTTSTATLVTLVWSTCAAFKLSVNVLVYLLTRDLSFSLSHADGGEWSELEIFV